MRTPPPFCKSVIAYFSHQVIVQIRYAQTELRVLFFFHSHVFGYVKWSKNIAKNIESGKSMFSDTNYSSKPVQKHNQIQGKYRF